MFKLIIFIFSGLTEYLGIIFFYCLLEKGVLTRVGENQTWNFVVYTGRMKENNEHTFHPMGNQLKTKEKEKIVSRASVICIFLFPLKVIRMFQPQQQFPI